MKYASVEAIRQCDFKMLFISQVLEVLQELQSWSIIHQSEKDMILEVPQATRLNIDFRLI